MTNYEKYKDEIIKFLAPKNIGRNISLAKNGEIKWCAETNCIECALSDGHGCSTFNFTGWLNADAETGKPANTIKMLMAKHPDENKARSWNIPEGMTVPDPGNYAIVENLNGYALVEIISTCEVAKDKAHLLTGHRGGVSKSVIKFILKSELKKGG